MTIFTKEDFSLTDFVSAYKRLGSIKKVAKDWRIPFETVRRNFYLPAVAAGLMDPVRVGGKTNDELLDPVIKQEPVVEGKLRALKTPALPLPPPGKVNRYILTCAQNNTKLHEGFWENLLAFEQWQKDRSHKTAFYVSRFIYQRTGLGAGSDKASLTNKQIPISGGVALWFDPRVEAHAADYRLEIAPGLVWCGEMNILPTAVRPLSGMDSYTGQKSTIIPHVKLALNSIASEEEGDPAKLLYTTGTVTLRNYIQRKAGLKAEFHHIYSALLVEVNSQGDWFVRHLNADSDGTFYDLDVKVERGRVTTGHRVAGITWGDPHVRNIDPVAHALAFAPGEMKDTLRPEVEFMGDVLDFRARPWQEVRDPHKMFKRHVIGDGDVRKEVLEVAEFTRYIHRDWCKTIYVYGNHEDKLGRWLKEEDGRKDPLNVEFWLEAQRETYYHIRHDPDNREPNYLQIAMRLVDPEACKLLTFLRNEEGYVICPDAAGGIQCGKHGHLGPRGRPGSPLAFARMGRKFNLQHFHAAGIVDGTYVAGTLEHLNPDWTNGAPSDWSHTSVITYENGKRTLITFRRGKWRA